MQRRAHRTSLANGFSAASLVSNLSGSAHDALTWISDDECVAYMESESTFDNQPHSGRDICRVVRTAP